VEFGVSMKFDLPGAAGSFWLLDMYLSSHRSVCSTILLDAEPEHMNTSALEHTTACTFSHHYLLPEFPGFNTFAAKPLVPKK
jgi:hypothetical protein